MKSKKLVGLTALVMAAAAPVAIADSVLFDFETGAQGWGSFGGGTTDSGNEVPGSAGTGIARFHTADFSDPAMTFGIVDVSPVGVDLSPFIGMSVDARFDIPTDLVGGQVPFGGTPEMKFMMALGYAEWSTTVVPTSNYQTFAVDFVNLTPNYYANLAPFFGSLPNLNDPSLQLKLVMPKGANTGVGRWHYDQIIGITPEPTAAGLLVAGGLVWFRRRRRT